ncbi:hypothetical protein ACI2K4_10860 [Micromonospora sp. NPDC050397]|uniref:hypothetical protein n=1 Tax=Micromonospora sp. NPDC050397 TaxID=3364279 RepID=UPI003850885D
MADGRIDTTSTPVASRWEVGSNFALHRTTPDRTAVPAPAAPPYGELFGSGRQALRALVGFGRREYGWTALHLPTYYCDEVVEAVADVLPVRRYPAGPTGGAPPVAGPGEVVLLVSYFGEPPVVPAPAGATLVVDATHDPRAPWLPGFGADYVFASLRKTMPLPDGGGLWSLTGRPLPAAGPPSARHLAVVDRVLAAMSLKAAYLAGAPLDKQRYLARYAAAEELLHRPVNGIIGISGISEFSRETLHALPVDRLRDRRIENAALLAADLAGVPGLKVRAHPLGVVLECASPERRETLRRGLIERSVYPAVLWRLAADPASAASDPAGAAADSAGSDPAAPDAVDEHVDYSRRMLFLHTDHRWGGSDMARVAELVRALHPDHGHPDHVHPDDDGHPDHGQPDDDGETGTLPGTGSSSPATPPTDGPVLVPRGETC